MTHSFGYGGAEVLVKDLLLSHDKNKFDVSACSILPRQGTSLEVELEQNGIVVHYLNKPIGPNLYTIFKLFKLLIHFKPDVIHTHCLGLSYAYLPAFLANIKVRIHTIHSVPGKETDWMKILAIKYFKFRPIGLTKNLAQNIDNYYKIKNTPWVYNGVIIEKFTKCLTKRREYRKFFGFEREQFIYVHVGRFFQAKNHRFLLNSFIEFLIDNPTAILLLVGDGPLMSEIQLIAKNYPENILLLGNRKDIPSLLNMADAFVLTSDWEGVPIVLLEAMAAEKPIIATAVGGIKDLIQHDMNGILIRPNDKTGLLEAMKKIVTDKSFAVLSAP